MTPHRVDRDRLLGEVSESQVLEAIGPAFVAGPAPLLGPGDDAALVAVDGAVIATTDSMVRGLDWRDDWSSAADVGAKLVAQNVADVAAMGGRCTALLLGLAADPQTRLGWVIDLAEAIAETAAEAGAAVVGGDLSSAPPGVVLLSVTALGVLDGAPLVRRSGARVGQVVAVRGTLGRSGGGLALLQAGTGEGRAADALRLAHRRPRPPWEAGREAALAGASAMIDLSDGLVRDAGRIATASGVSIDLDRSVLLREHVAGPLLDVFGEEGGLQHVLGGGEEHSLLATFAAGDVPPGWSVIGAVVGAVDGVPVSVDQQPPTVTGWDHFAG